MSVTCGFFNAIEHDRRYNAEQMSSIFDGIINDGVFMNIGSAFAVKGISDDAPEETEGNMNVYVHPGRCWFDHTWTMNDAIEPLEVEQSELVLDRIDIVVLEVNHEDSVRENIIKIVKGTPSTEPVPPELINTEYVHQHPFAHIYVKAGVTQINTADITNFIGTSECPFVDGILKTIDADILIAQWMDQFTRWFNSITKRVDRFLRLFTHTLSAGETTVSFTDPLITEDSLFSFYTGNLNVMPIAVSVDGSTNTITVSYEAQSEDTFVGVSIDG